MTCYELTMNEFLKHLLGDEELPEWWDSVYSEYIGLRENKSSSFILELIKEIIHLQTKKFVIIKCVEVLSTQYSRDLVQELKLCGCRGAFDWSNKAGYSNDLRAANAYAKRYNSQIFRKEQELENYNKKHGGGSATRKDFEVWKVTLSMHNKYRIDFNSTTVSEWCILMNEYDKYCEVVNAENENLLNKQTGYGRR